MRIIAWVIIFLLSCNGKSEKEKICTPGTTQSCICPGDIKGAQSCEKDGLSWGECKGCIITQDARILDQALMQKHDLSYKDISVVDTVYKYDKKKDSSIQDISLHNDFTINDMPESDSKIHDINVPFDLKTDTQIPDTALPDKGFVVAPGYWVTLPSGTFNMGSPASEPCRFAKETLHEVTLTHKFEIQEKEVTQGEYFVNMSYNPSFFGSCGADCPVENVNWYEAAAYCNKLSEQKGLQKCYTCSGVKSSVVCSEDGSYSGQLIYSCPGYRLPTDAEWEYAYRAGTTTAYYNGNNNKNACYDCKIIDANADKIAWYCNNSSVTYAGCYNGAPNKPQCMGPHPVGQKAPNKWYLYDLAGNVNEWCNDWYQNDLGTDSVKDPWGAISGTKRVIRGGGWIDIAYDIRAAIRNPNPPTPDARGKSIGFRCVERRPLRGS